MITNEASPWPAAASLNSISSNYRSSCFSFANINGMYLGTKSISEKDSMNGIIMTQGREFLPHS